MALCAAGEAGLYLGPVVLRQTALAGGEEPPPRPVPSLARRPLWQSAAGAKTPVAYGAALGDTGQGPRPRLRVVGDVTVVVLAGGRPLYVGLRPTLVRVAVTAKTSGTDPCPSRTGLPPRPLFWRRRNALPGLGTTRQPLTERLCGPQGRYQGLPIEARRNTGLVARGHT